MPSSANFFWPISRRKNSATLAGDRQANVDHMTAVQVHVTGLMKSKSYPKPDVDRLTCQHALSYARLAGYSLF